MINEIDNLPRRKQQKGPDEADLILSAKETFSKVAGTRLTTDEAAEIVSQFKSLLQLLTDWEAEGAFKSDQPAAQNHAHVPYYYSQHDSTK